MVGVNPRLTVQKVEDNFGASLRSYHLVLCYVLETFVYLSDISLTDYRKELLSTAEINENYLIISRKAII